MRQGHLRAPCRARTGGGPGDSQTQCSKRLSMNPNRSVNFISRKPMIFEMRAKHHMSLSFSPNAFNQNTHMLQEFAPFLCINMNINSGLTYRSSIGLFGRPFQH